MPDINAQTRSFTILKYYFVVTVLNHCTIRGSVCPVRAAPPHQGGHAGPPLQRIVLDFGRLPNFQTVSPTHGKPFTVWPFAAILTGGCNRKPKKKKTEDHGGPPHVYLKVFLSRTKAMPA